jgi:hypothetical protein
VRGPKDAQVSESSLRYEQLTELFSSDGLHRHVDVRSKLKKSKVRAVPKT